MSFNDSFLEELTARNDIVDVVSSYVSLSKKSGNNLFGLCPFHNEKTPSFSVSRDKQIYHCFGCGKGGSVINFIMEVEGLSFSEAVEFLAKRAGLEIPEQSITSESKNIRSRILSLNTDAARFYHKLLLSPEGTDAVEYLRIRNIKSSTATRFGLGFAKDSWDSLCRAMLKLGYTYQELFEAGLCKKSSKNTGAFYDSFRNRLMFPVIDVKGAVVGFSGRALGNNEPKYLNSSDTPVFNKSKNLFAINLAKKTHAKSFILCEGNIDVVSLHQAGFDNAVASLGTALTSEQAKLISRFTDSVIIAYDNDSAGQKAAKRSIPIFESVGLQVRVLQMDNAKDPDEYIQKYGSDRFSILLNSSPNRIDYQINQIRNKYNLSNENDKISYLDDITSFLSSLNNDIEKEVYSGRIASEIGISKSAVLNETNKKSNKALKNNKKKFENDVVRISQKYQSKDHTLRYNDVISAAAEEGIIRLLILEPDLIELACGLDVNDFSSDYLFKIFSIIKNKISENSTVSVPTICAHLGSSESQKLAEIMLKPEVLADSKNAFSDYLLIIKKQRSVRELKDGLNQQKLSEILNRKKGYGE